MAVPLKFRDSMVVDLDALASAFTTTPSINTDHEVRWLQTASELYDQVTFKTDTFFNRPAPEYWVSFIIGVVFALFGFLLWVHRVYQTQRQLQELKMPFNISTFVRAFISRAIDNDDATYTVVSFTAFSFLFLAGIQLSYQLTLVAMLVVYGVASLGDTLRILLAVASTDSLADVVQTSPIIDSKLREVKTQLKPSNVYEDLGRGTTIVTMVFITQFILISFVFVDLYDSQTASCRDGSANCPVGGTLGSYGFYVLGIFMACVYILGPKTAFGQSEQNPAYWIQLFIAAKRTGASVTWFDPVENKTMKRALSPQDARLWARFLMSYLINGVGFHILVHALPIQVATQSSLTGVVIRAVGMMYLVDLDDTSGYTLTITEDSSDDTQNKEKTDNKHIKETGVTDFKLTGTEEETVKDNNEKVGALSSANISLDAQRIVAEAKAQLDALARGDYNMNKRAKIQAGDKLAAAAILTAGEIANNYAGGSKRGRGGYEGQDNDVSAGKVERGDGGGIA